MAAPNIFAIPRPKLGDVFCRDVKRGNRMVHVEGMVIGIETDAERPDDMWSAVIGDLGGGKSIITGDPSPRSDNDWRPIEWERDKEFRIWHPVGLVFDKEKMVWAPVTASAELVDELADESDPVVPEAVGAPLNAFDDLPELPRL